jgi:GT2 family glycosyltransferase
MIEKKPLVSVVIINFNSGEFIFDCIQHVIDQAYINVEIIVIDNASTDGSSAKLSERIDIDYFYSKENLGSSRANNLGISKSSGEYILVLNADVFLSKSYVTQLLEFMESNKRVGTTIGLLVSDEDSAVIDSAGIEIFYEGVCHEKGMGKPLAFAGNDIVQVDGVCCAAALYRKEMLDNIQYQNEYFDKLMFAFVEDSDLSVRSTLLGWKSYMIPTARAAHLRGGSTGELSDFVIYLNLLNCEIMYRKIFSTYLTHRFFKMALDFIRLFTVKQDLRFKLNKDIERMEQEIELKRLHLVENKNYRRLNLRVSGGSYIFRRIFENY